MFPHNYSCEQNASSFQMNCTDLIESAASFHDFTAEER